MTAIGFLTRTGQTCTKIRQEFILLSDVLGVSALVDGLNNPTVSGGTNSSVLGPFLTDDAPDGMITHCHPNCLYLSYHQSASEIPSPLKAKESTCTSRGVS